MDLAERKQELRSRLRARRLQVSPSAAQAAGEAVARHLESAPELRAARRVALYAPLPGEVPTAPLFALCRVLGKRTLVPRVRRNRLEFVAVPGLDELRPGRYGVPEPSAERAAEPLEVDDLVLLPGLAFDRHGHRLGRGAGFYDRTFPAGRTGPHLFGIGFAFQLVQTVPSGPGDRAVDAVVTEAGLERARSDGSDAAS